MSPDLKLIYEFGEFSFDTEKRVLSRLGEIVSITPKASDVLAMLLERPGELVERQELINSVWADTFVEDGNLNQAISALRKVLGPDMIRTVPRRGYCFIADIEISERSSDDRMRPPDPRPISPEEDDDSEVLDPVFAGRPVREEGMDASPAPAVLRFALSGAVLILLAAGAWWLGAAWFEGEPVKASGIRSLAILPLKSFSQDGSDEELRLRITDALITKLGTIDDLIVRPTNSVLQFATVSSDALEAGRELGVDAVLDGRVQNEGERLRVTLQLISTSTGDQLWSAQFDGRENELLALQDAISTRFEQDLSLKDTQRGKRRPVSNTESFEAYLKGRYLWNQRRKENYYKALEYFQKSVDIDPDFALGYTGIADCYYLLQQRNVLSANEAMTMAENAARKALELDPYLAEAHSSMGAVSLIRYDRRSEAEAYYKRAIELNPNLAEPYGRLGMLYNSLRRFDEAHTVLKTAEQLDPTSINIAIYLGANYYFAKRFDEAISQFTRILEFAPDTERAHFFLTRIFEQTGQYDLAVKHALKERAVIQPGSVQPLEEAYRRGGIRGFWLKQIELLKEEARSMHGLENHIASRYALLGDAETACDFIEKDLELGGSMMNYGSVDPLFDPLRAEPRFIRLMARTAAGAN